MNEMAKSTLEAMIKIYKEGGMNTDFVNFQERLRDMKEEVERLKKGNPQYKSMIDEIILVRLLRDNAFFYQKPKGLSMLYSW